MDREKIEEILNSMLDEMDDGGMDTSYRGHNFDSAINNAIEKIEKEHYKTLELKII